MVTIDHLKIGSTSFLLDLLDFGPDPLLERGVQFCLITLSLKILDSFASVIQSNEVTRDFLGVVLVGNEINQVALTAWPGPKPDHNN